ncbi:hypothetical protein CEUSTIGMA_g7978.t1 [Chlamydomonas eustigma]|uniref:Uncharacterized protein n=1 Tax=Chlamydomonas eustigma TaxID=1157962 RepID=A0A250XCQ9_9CHLO|nr:hypothetical protein CEUSTIGMA_g7978.t1 [Chlamydomonas eustigma]|eukprot:GAX80540.1 hypothetical protein CEUSTIGMA_g7978.t1 [Chlamydomonas eustigma]
MNCPFRFSDRIKLNVKSFRLHGHAPSALLPRLCAKRTGLSLNELRFLEHEDDDSPDNLDEELSVVEKVQAPTQTLRAPPRQFVHRASASSNSAAQDFQTQKDTEFSAGWRNQVFPTVQNWSNGASHAEDRDGSFFNPSKMPEVEIPAKAFMNASSSKRPQSLQSLPRTLQSGSHLRDPLVAKIKDCSNWFQLRALILTCSRGSLNTSHVISALCHLAAIARYNKEGQQEQKEFFAFLDLVILPIAQRLFVEMSSRELCSCCHAVAAVGHVPVSTWISDLLDAAAPQLGSFTPRELATLTWALGALVRKSKQLPSSIVTDDTQERQQRIYSSLYASTSGNSASRESRGSVFNSSGRVLRATNITRCHVSLPPSWCSDRVALMSLLLSASMKCMNNFNGQDLSTMAVGLERLGHQPNKTWCKVYLGRVAAVTKDLNSQALSNILHSLDQLGVQPEMTWLTALAADTSMSMQSCSGHALASLAGSMTRLWSSSRIGMEGLEGTTAAIGQPPIPSSKDLTYLRTWAIALLTEAHRRLEDPFHPLPGRRSAMGKSEKLLTEDLVSLALSAPGLIKLILPSGRDCNKGCDLIMDWLPALYTVFQFHMPSMTPRQLASCVVAAVRIQDALKDLDLGQKDFKSALHLSSTTAPELIEDTSWVMSSNRNGSSAPQLGDRLINMPWLRTWLLCTSKAAPHFNAADTAQSLWALASLRCKCRKKPVLSSSSAAKNAIAKHSQHDQLASKKQIQALEGRDLLSTATALTLSVPWLESFLNYTKHCLAGMRSGELCMSVWAVSQLGYEPSWQWSLAWFDASKTLMVGASSFCVVTPHQPSDLDFSSPSEPSVQMWQNERKRRHDGMPPSQSSRLHHISSEDLGVMMLGLGHLRQRPVMAWTSNFIQLLLRSSSDQLQGRALSHTLWGMYRMKLTLGSAVLLHILQIVSEKASSMSRDEAILSAWSVTRLWMNSRHAGKRALSTAVEVVKRRRRRPRVLKPVSQENRVRIQNNLRKQDQDEDDHLAALRISKRARSPLFQKRAIASEAVSCDAHVSQAVMTPCAPPLLLHTLPIPPPDLKLRGPPLDHSPLLTSAPQQVMNESEGPQQGITDSSGVSTARPQYQRESSRNLHIRSSYRLCIEALLQSANNSHVHSLQSIHCDGSHTSFKLSSFEVSIEKKGSPTLNSVACPSARATAMLASTLALLTRRPQSLSLATLHSNYVISLLLIYVKVLSDLSSASADLRMNKRGEREGQGSNHCWDAATFLSSLAALRRLRSLAGKRPSGSRWRSLKHDWVEHCDSAWCSSVCSVAVKFIPHMNSLQICSLMDSLSVLCKMSITAEEIPQLRDQQQQGELLNVLLSTAANVAVARVADLQRFRLNAIDSLKKNGILKKRVAGVTPAVSPVLVAKLAVAVIVRLEIKLSTANLKWLKLQLSTGLKFLPYRSRQCAQAALSSQQIVEVN